MKKILFALFLSLILTLTAFASDTVPLLTDGADLLSHNEESFLTEKLREVSEKNGVEVAVMTSNTLLEYYSAEEAATELYESTGYGTDGVMLFICMETREWYILTSGFGQKAISNSDCDRIFDEMADCLYEDEFYYAFEIFAEECDDYLSSQRIFPVGQNLVICLIIGLVAAFIVTAVMKGQLRSVRSRMGAEDYLKKGSMKVTVSRDLFLYRNVTRHRKANNGSSGSHRSSSGRSYGGRGGRF